MLIHKIKILGGQEFTIDTDQIIFGQEAMEVVDGLQSVNLQWTYTPQFKAQLVPAQGAVTAARNAQKGSDLLVAGECLDSLVEEFVRAHAPKVTGHQ